MTWHRRGIVPLSRRFDALSMRVLQEAVRRLESSLPEAHGRAGRVLLFEALLDRPPLVHAGREDEDRRCAS
jgi:hypothetical protein